MSNSKSSDLKARTATEAESQALRAGYDIKVFETDGIDEAFLAGWDAACRWNHAGEGESSPTKALASWKPLRKSLSEYPSMQNYEFDTDDVAPEKDGSIVIMTGDLHATFGVRMLPVDAVKLGNALLGCAKFLGAKNL